MVITRSGLSGTRPQVSSESSQQKSSALQEIGTHLESKKELGTDARSTAEKQSSVLSRKRTSRNTGPPSEISEPATDAEVSEAESHASGVSSVLEVQEPIIRITRKRKVVIAPTPKSSVRKRQKIAPQHESLEEEVVSEAESHASGVSMVVPSAKRSKRSKAKSQRDSSQESQAEAISDGESSCSGISSFEISPRRTTRNMQKELQSQAEKKDTKLVPGNKKQIMGTSVNSENSDTRQTCQLPVRPHSQINRPNFSNNETYNDFDDSIHRNSEKKQTTQNHQCLHIQKEKEASVESLTEIRKENCNNLDEEDTKMTEEEEINEKRSPLNLSEVQDTSLQQSVSQNHSSILNSEAMSKPSSPNHGALIKSLEYKFAVVKIERLNEERAGSLKRSDLTQLSDRGYRNKPASVDVSENNSRQSDVGLECDTKACKSELSVSQDMDSSVLLFLSSDESQQSENSENEKDTVCSVENSGQEESARGDLEDTACGGALFVIDRTPGLSADKNFYLEDKAPSEVAIEEEEKEEEDENSEEESSDSDENKDESSDEEDLLSNTKSKLLKLTSSSIDPGLNIKQLGGLYINFNVDKPKPHKKTLTQIKEKKKNELLQKAVITPDFEKNYCIPPYSESKHQLQKQRRKERQKTAGNGWFGMKAPELTDELKNDLKALKMRASMDPKRFYKKNDRDGFPKYFQVGTIVDNPADFYHSRVPKKQRKKTIVEELLADSEFRRFNRRKYSEIMAEKAANAAGKKFRKKKKFRN
ncbi:deoxynucleotidyltransferase terminal-interacting protein 2 [Cricetulus griseus]|uniref:Deoxynucleotidyltransferase terminal-interacting protein 2 n=1 Tax=Cricetulus griseus TaxID=10029 RepID=G3IG95_CRIGR|nr:deoxynucleotidyltransferase terminal-interacting protein 2 [Cricetulus griseus]XP_027251441.1 deoxynucleotidyltransferase terminal-interacting protein 2 [Cricetulus griseus]EGV94178.1 Deoxynucleotidyltransferase terminal-interacting protein 2 [Cricetulus griseus]ERE88596.1 deoxynucleotidyltransferase terminal-interacting protein 2 [Cricetulus griseus]